jgi:hypothetical protein
MISVEFRALGPPKTWVGRDSAKKAQIIEAEKVLHRRNTNFADLAIQYPPSGGWHGNPREKAGQKRKRANQIRMRVQHILSDLNLAAGKRK